MESSADSTTFELDRKLWHREKIENDFGVQTLNLLQSCYSISKSLSVWDCSTILVPLWLVLQSETVGFDVCRCVRYSRLWFPT